MLLHVSLERHTWWWLETCSWTDTNKTVLINVVLADICNLESAPEHKKMLLTKISINFLFYVYRKHASWRDQGTASHSFTSLDVHDDHIAWVWHHAEFQQNLTPTLKHSFLIVSCKVFCGLKVTLHRVVEQSSNRTLSDEDSSLPRSDAVPSPSVNLDLEGQSTRIPWNIRNHSPSDTASHHRTLETSAIPMREP